MVILGVGGFGRCAKKMDEHDPIWEEHAQEAVQRAWDSAEYDEVRGVIEIPDADDPHHRSVTCKDFDDVHAVLSQIYLSEWHGYVPYDSGEAVFEADESGYASDFLSDNREVEEFFSGLSVADAEEELYESQDHIDPENSSILKIDLEEINDELIKYLALHPQVMRELDPRKFEILIAEIMKDKGYDVELTPRSKDGGRDILVMQRNDIGEALTLIECKRHSEKNTVGVGIVRGLYGVVCAENATRGMVATTSFFTKDAKAFRDKVKYRLGLADFDVLRGMLSQFKRR